MIRPRSMSNKSLRGLLRRAWDGTFDGVTCEGEAADWGSGRKAVSTCFRILTTLERQ